MAHNVKCLYCDKTFNIELIPFTKPRANRYAHIECDNKQKQKMVEFDRLKEANDLAIEKAREKVFLEEERLEAEIQSKKVAAAASLSQESQDMQNLLNYVSKLFGKKFDYISIRSQIVEYKNKFGYSYSGMLKALVYFYEVKNNSIEKSNFKLGILPYIYQDAYNYYYNIYLINQNNIDKSKEDYMPVIKEVVIKPRKQKKKNIKLFNVEIEEVL